MLDGRKNAQADAEQDMRNPERQGQEKIWEKILHAVHQNGMEPQSLAQVAEKFSVQDPPDDRGDRGRHEDTGKIPNERISAKTPPDDRGRDQK